MSSVLCEAWRRGGYVASMLLSGMLLGMGCGGGSDAPSMDASDTTSTKTVSAQYVGDEACASCHGELYNSYHRTGMGRSLSRFDPEEAPERLEDTEPVYHEPTDFYYEAFRRNDTLFQREFRLSDAGEVTFERTHPVEWVIGSGNATRSYLSNVNGYVREMPLTWYVERAKWDMSPGYRQSNMRFDRPITEECMTCHNGYPEHSTFTQGHYDLSEMPLGITCERCHGPGSEHVDMHLTGLGPAEGEDDSTIVNPADLGRMRQLDVCRQCHLTGLSVVKPGKSMTSFRPGEPLAAHRAIFVTKQELEDPAQFGIASHAVRLAKSACFEQSEMTCTTCHDPHRPTAELGREHFNEACQSCHTPDEMGQPVCSREEAHNIEDAMSGDCVSCHLQQGGTSDIPHVTFTDHWIRRDPPDDREPAEFAGEGLIRSVGAEPLQLVRMTERPETDDAQAQLERAVAYFELYETKHKRPEYLDSTTAAGRRGLAAGATLAEGRIAVGRALLEKDSLHAAERVLSQAANVYPEQARIQYWLGVTRYRAGELESAIDPLKRAWSIQPAFLEAGIKLGEVLTDTERLDAAQRVLKEVVRRNPRHHPEAWNNLGFVLMKKEQLDQALTTFERALALHPDLAEALVNAGSIHLMRGELKDAQHLFERSIAAHPDYTPAYGNLGMVYARQGQYARARDMLQQLLERNPNDQRARAMLRQLDQKMGEATN